MRFIFSVMRTNACISKLEGAVQSTLQMAIPRMAPEWPPDLVKAAVREESVPLLLRRMFALGIDVAAVDKAAPILLAELDAKCLSCTSGEVCDRDLTTNPDGLAWMNYCPNAILLRELSGIELRMGAGRSNEGTVYDANR
jgi:hypothetical protein